MINPISLAPPLVRCCASLVTMACAALALFQTFRGANVSVQTKPATFAASGVSNTFASYWAAISFGVIVFPISNCQFPIGTAVNQDANRKLAIGNRQSAI